MTNKTCTICGEDAFLNEFRELHNQCNKCLAKRQREGVANGTRKPPDRAQIDGYYRQNVAKYLYNACRVRARKFGLEINITHEDLIVPTICPVLGIRIERQTKRASDNSPSVDRIDNTKGYIKGNVRVISNRANRLKSDANFDDIHKLWMDAVKSKEEWIPGLMSCYI